MYVTNLELTNNSQKMVVCPLQVWDKVTQGRLTDSECMGFLHAVINISQKKSMGRRLYFRQYDRDSNCLWFIG